MKQKPNVRASLDYDELTCLGKPVKVKKGEEWFFDEKSGDCHHEDGRRIPFCPMKLKEFSGAIFVAI